MKNEKLNKFLIAFLWMFFLGVLSPHEITYAIDIETSVVDEQEKTFYDIFPDRNLAEGIARAYFRQPEDIITIPQLNELSSYFFTIILNDLQIEDLEGIQHLTFTRNIHLDSNSISNIEPLGNLKNLRTLFLQSNNLINVDPLSSLINLESLWIGYNQINNIDPLSELKNLRTLLVNDNEINYIESLRHLTNLDWIHLSNNQIRDVEPLANLVNLTTLNLSGNRINDLSSLGNISGTLIATNQFIELPAVPYGDFTNGIFIRNRTGQTPLFTASTGGLYWPDQGVIEWSRSGQNFLSWSEPNFSGTITQYVY